VCSINERIIYSSNLLQALFKTMALLDLKGNKGHASRTGGPAVEEEQMDLAMVLPFADEEVPVRAVERLRVHLIDNIKTSL
jgi:hypothetical protein